MLFVLISTSLVLMPHAAGSTPTNQNKNADKFQKFSISMNSLINKKYEGPGNLCAAVTKLINKTNLYDLPKWHTYKTKIYSSVGECYVDPDGEIVNKNGEIDTEISFYKTYEECFNYNEDETYCLGDQENKQNKFLEMIENIKNTHTYEYLAILGKKLRAVCSDLTYTSKLDIEKACKTHKGIYKFLDL